MEKQAGLFAPNEGERFPLRRGQLSFVAAAPKFPLTCHQAVRYPLVLETLTYEKAVTSHGNYRLRAVPPAGVFIIMLRGRRGFNNLVCWKESAFSLKNNAKRTPFILKGAKRVSCKQQT